MLARVYDTLRSVIGQEPARIAAIFFLLILFNAALAYLFCAAVVGFLAGWPMIYFVAGGVAVSILAPLVYFFGLRPYQQDRVLIFLNPENDPLGKGYHITQSKIAIGSGGIFGKGFGNGTQSHLDYLPEGHTDFIFATMAEEWGLFGGLIIIGLYVLLMRWGLKRTSSLRWPVIRLLNVNDSPQRLKGCR